MRWNCWMDGRTQKYFLLTLRHLSANVSEWNIVQNLPGDWLDRARSK